MLETDRLFFRPYCPDNLPFLARLLKDPDVVRFIGHGRPRTDEEVARFYDWVQRSYAFEAARAFREYAAAAKGLRRLICLIQPGNAASVRVAQKIGMIREKEIVIREKQVHVYAWEQS
ncbi:MAG: hypothetical protein DF221_11555 [Brevibacillus sp.]|nr:MAG: hypothetical protein DF221_11555 [Brevibacillus sp.]